MKPIDILKVLNLAQVARNNDEVFNPLFSGDAGLAKSAVCQLWVKKQRERNPKFGFIDRRLAYDEAPDIKGFPEIEKDATGRKRTTCALPDFWPTDPDSEGLLLFEEPNRATTGVMNTMMQILTDRKIGDYTLPDKWVIAACINPDSAEYDVNAMDAALKNRFEIYDIEYDHNSFVDYMEQSKWHHTVISFVKSGIWIFKDAKSIGKDGVYISPRTWSKVNAAEKAGVSKDRGLHYVTMCSVLGKDIGKEYVKYVFDEAPVTNVDILEHKKNAFKKLKEQSDPNNYRGDMIAATIESITKNYTTQEGDDDEKGLIGEKTMAEVAMIIPSDQAINLIKSCGFKYSKKVNDCERIYGEVSTVVECYEEQY